MNQPTIGRIVHYKMNSGEARPAIITDVTSDGLVTLTVFEFDNTEPCVQAKGMAEGPNQAESGQWWWPERI
jgi:hypothetical protein